MLSRMFDVEGFILVGGQSSRMGRDKSQLMFGTQTGVEHIAAALGALTSRVRLVGAHGQEKPGLQNIPDTLARWGALGGIHAALAEGASEWAAIIASYPPLVSVEFYAMLWIFTTIEEDAFDAIVLIQPDDRPQPLCAIYRRASCSAIVSQLISENEHKLRALLAKVRTRWVNFDEISDLPGAREFFLNVNTPEDYELARGIHSRKRG
jgi:molybdopterin-guanine dinucleotide biosynthesis protein A